MSRRGRFPLRSMVVFHNFTAVRFWVLLILLSLVPQLALGQSRVVCLGDDHVRLDCHSVISDADACAGDTHDESQTPSEPADCVDVTSAEFNVHPTRHADFDATVALHLPLLIQSPLLTILSACPAAVDLSPPRAFCARFHSCSIVIRC